jgi:hypothetical protein
MTRYEPSHGRDGSAANIIDEDVVGPAREPEGEVSYENVEAVLADIEEAGSVTASLEDRSYDEPSVEAEETTGTYDDIEAGNPFTDDPVTGTKNDLLL